MIECNVLATKFAKAWRVGQQVEPTTPSVTRGFRDEMRTFAAVVRTSKESSLLQLPEEIAGLRFWRIVLPDKTFSFGEPL